MSKNTKRGLKRAKIIKKLEFYLTVLKKHHIINLPFTYMIGIHIRQKANEVVGLGLCENSSGFLGKSGKAPGYI
jgi:hypothetical protein